MKKVIARNGKRLMANVLFWARRTFVEKNLDPRQNSILISWATYSPWLLDHEFQATHQIIKDRTLVDIYRCYELWHLLAQTSHLDGDVLEVGTWRGGTGCLLGKRAALLGLETEIFLCDTFTGVVKTSDHDASYGGGEHADTSVPIVEELAKELGLDNIRILTGIFPEDTGNAVSDRTFRLCHIDVDVYQSGKDVLTWVWARMPVGGIVVFDDFGFPARPESPNSSTNLKKCQIVSACRILMDMPYLSKPADTLHFSPFGGRHTLAICHIMPFAASNRSTAI